MDEEKGEGQAQGKSDASAGEAERRRDGRTRAHYEKQKNQQYAYFRVRSEDLHKLEGFQFTIYDFITNSFAFSQTKKELAINVLEALKERPLSFIELQKKLQAKKSTLYLLVLSLQRSGLITKAEKNAKMRLSSDFSDTLKLYAEWWQRWLESV